MNDKTKYWLDLAEYDMETAIAMYESGRYLYVGFMCHQVIEKVIKAHYVSSSQISPPYIHSLLNLAKKSNLFELFSEEQKDLLTILEPLNIEARYPSYKDSLFQYLTKEKCEEIIFKTKELYTWIKQKL